MEKYNIDITETELQYVASALSMFNEFVERDEDGTIERKIKDVVERNRYKETVKATADKFRRLLTQPN